jgi:TonB-dependent receptor
MRLISLKFYGEISMYKYLLSLMLLLPLSTFVAAQDAEDEAEVEEVVTTGIKSSLKDAIDIKRKNVGVVDAISAEDIGKFPDGNLAESLSRLVGVTTERSNDEGTKISVRGLGPEFNLVTLNGRSMPTVPGRYVGGRSFNFGDISSHGISAVEVYKSANATLPTGGLGSTVNMVTTKPLDIDRDVIGSFSAKAYDHSKGESITPEVDFVYATKNVNDEISWGFSVSGSHQDRENREDGTNEIPWVPMVSEGLTFRIPGNAAITNNNQRADGEFFHPEYLNYRFKNNKRIRNNAQTAFQVEVGKVRATLDYTWSDVEFETDGVQYGSYFGGWNLREAVINENGAVVSAMETHQGDPWYGESFTNSITWGENKSSNKSLGLNIEIAATDSLTLDIDYHNSSAAKKGNPDGSWADNFVSFSGATWPGFGDGGIYEQAGSMFDRRFDFNNPVGSLSWVAKRFYCCDANGVAQIPGSEFEAQDLAGREGSIVYEDKRSDNSQLQFNGTWDNESGLVMDSLVSVEFGASRLKQTFNAQKYRNDMRGSSHLGPGNPIMLAYALWDDSAFTKVNQENFLGSGSSTHYFTMTPQQAQYLFERTGWVSGLGGWWQASSPDTWECTANDAVDASGNPNGLTNGAGEQTTSRGVMCKGGVDSDETVSETVESIYANFNFEHTTTTGGEIRAQLGLRYEDVQRTSIGAAALPLQTIWGFGNYTYQGVNYDGQRINMVDGPVQTFVDMGSSDSFLPNFNISYEFAENQLVRFSASKTLSRPALETLSSSFTMSQYLPFQPRQVFAGNPNLQPYTAENFDVAYEHYYKEGSYFAVNYFRKDISDYHGSGQGTTSFNNVVDVSGGDLLANVDSTVNNAFCAWTGYTWGCAPWVNQVQDYAWVAGTGFTFRCSGSGRSDAGCVPSETGNPDAVFVGSAADGDPLAQFEVFRPVNKYEGTLDGFEVAVQHLFDNNFGVLANATFVGGDTDVDETYVGEQFALPGFGDAANLSVFYEVEKYSVRVSYNLKAETYAGMDSYNPLFVEERGQVDLSATYNINDNSVVFFEAQNVSDEDVRLFARHKEMLFLYQDQGPVYKLGFRYKL